MKLSIIICTHNEENTILEIVRRVRLASLPTGWTREIFIVDNLSTDSTRSLLAQLEDDTDVKVLYQTVNKGKSHSIRKALPLCTGDYIIPQDADLEYNPCDYAALINSALSKNLDVVIGSRTGDSRRYHVYRINEWGIARLTSLTNFLFSTDYTDVATCYKLMRRDQLELLRLRSNGFNLDFELCAKFAKHKWRIGEVKIRYESRTFQEGRKMRPIAAGIGAIGTILRERVTTN
jgi:glycosyltransferase involved in cell wall biosynthesis